MGQITIDKNATTSNLKKGHKKEKAPRHIYIYISATVPEATKHEVECNEAIKSRV